MKKVWAFTGLLLLGLLGSQLLPGMLPEDALAFYGHGVRLLTMWCLSFIMILVGYEFDVDKGRLGAYGWDYVVAATAAAFPWILVAAYFVFVLAPPETQGTWESWKESLLAARFAAPTSAGVLFSMLAAAGLSATWLFRKARILAIFDDLDTVLLMIPLKMMIVGVRWELGLIVFAMAAMLYCAWRWLHAVRLPLSWPWVSAYAAAIVLFSELIYHGSRAMEDVVAIHLEVLLPAFVVGCMLARQAHGEGPESPEELRAAAMVSGAFMVLVGLSMPLLSAASGDGRPLPGAGIVALHVAAVTILSNLGKMFPAFCYRREAHWRERLATAVAMFPRGEVGAGVIVVSLSYGILGLPIVVALFSLALNLVLTGPIISLAIRLVSGVPAGVRP